MKYIAQVAKQRLTLDHRGLSADWAATFWLMIRVARHQKPTGTIFVYANEPMAAVLKAQARFGFRQSGGVLRNLEMDLEVAPYEKLEPIGPVDSAD